MATTDESAPTEDGEAPAQDSRQAAAEEAELQELRSLLTKLGLVKESRPYWNLNEDDKRLLLITFAGGLAANVGLVLVIAGGLLIAHQAHRHPGVVRALQDAVEAETAVAVLVLGSAFVSRTPRVYRTLRIVSLVIAIVALAITVLGVLGYAAGIK